eukprot:TRINITY_DN346_c2_g2_i2.p1 TRINITY_DN346_c2_g2~~TRINITY_DN346_c2_g2_i2.p1  ORF type:complete len:154 (-),score=14.54 TRINITY_DN346_c2_g2_i2:52-474(-)
MAKALLITAFEAANLALTNNLKTIDPYCVLHYYTNKFRSKIISSSTSPIWNETWQIQIKPKEKLEFLVWDKSALGADNFLGMININVDDLQLYKEGGCWYDLCNRSGKKDRDRGRIRIQLSLLEDKEIRSTPSIYFFFLI